MHKNTRPGDGAGSFLIHTIDYMASKLLESLECHQRIFLLSNGTISVIINNQNGEFWNFKDKLDYDTRIRAESTQFIVANCIYGVDIDPIAVELVRFLVSLMYFAVWDKKGPITANLKVGNSLLGGWIADLATFPEKPFPGKGEMRPKRAKFGTFTLQKLKLHFRKVMEKKKSLNKIQMKYQIKNPLDAWCSIWFWDPDFLSNCPIDINSINTPLDPSECDSIGKKHGFFHWELEFPSIFQRENPGFDVILGNPPWEILKPNSKEFFGKIDPLYPNFSSKRGCAGKIIYFRNKRSYNKIGTNMLDILRPLVIGSRTVPVLVGDNPLTFSALSSTKGGRT